MEGGWLFNDLKRSPADPLRAPKVRRFEPAIRSTIRNHGSDTSANMFEVKKPPAVSYI